MNAQVSLIEKPKVLDWLSLQNDSLAFKAKQIIETGSLVAGVKLDEVCDWLAQKSTWCKEAGQAYCMVISIGQQAKN